MKVLFLLFSLVFSFSLYIAPFATYQHFARKKWHENIIKIDFKKKTDIALIAAPFSIWFLLYLIDPTQKTIRQMLFVDTIIIGSIVLILLMIRQNVSKKTDPDRFSKLAVFLACISAVVSWFVVPPME